MDEVRELLKTTTNILVGLIQEYHIWNGDCSTTFSHTTLQKMSRQVKANRKALALLEQDKSAADLREILDKAGWHMSNDNWKHWARVALDQIEADHIVEDEPCKVCGGSEKKMETGCYGMVHKEIPCPACQDKPLENARQKAREIQDNIDELYEKCAVSEQEVADHIPEKIHKYEIHLKSDTKEEFYTKLRALIPEDLFERTRVVPADYIPECGKKVESEFVEKVRSSALFMLEKGYYYGTFTEKAKDMCERLEAETARADAAEKAKAEILEKMLILAHPPKEYDPVYLMAKLKAANEQIERLQAKLEVTEAEYEKLQIAISNTVKEINTKTCGCVEVFNEAFGKAVMSNWNEEIKQLQAKFEAAEKYAVCDKCGAMTRYNKERFCRKCDSKKMTDITIEQMFIKLEAAEERAKFNSIEKEHTKTMENEIKQLQEQKERLALDLLRIDNYCRVNDIDIEQALNH